MKLFVRNLALLFLTLGLLVSIGCSSDAKGEVCSNGGQQCSCTDDCSRTCETSGGTGCQFTCAAGKTCSFDCKAGDCTIACGAGSTCSVACAGGGCRITSEANASLDVTCGNKGTCTAACTGTKKCNVDGVPATGAPSAPGVGIPDVDAGE